MYVTGASVNSGSLACSSYTGCTVLYIGDGISSTNVIMTANWNLTCLGAIQFVVRNNANIDFATNNYNLNLAANSSIVIEPGGNISASTNCSASDLIYIGSIKVASCNGGGGAENDFPGLVSDGGFNVISASATPICGSGTSVISATINPAPSASTTYRWYTVASGGTAFLTTTVSSSPYSTTYTTGTLSTSTTYYVEATSGSLSTARKAVTVVVNAIPAAPSVTTTQPTCSVATGTITITAPTGTGMTYSKDGSTYTNTTGIFTSLTSGTYSITAKSSAGCISSATSVTINVQPATPVQPTLGTVTQPTCSVATGSFSITNYNASYTYAVSPSTGVTISGSGITAPAGTYTVTATLGSCTSVASASKTVNAQPATPVQPTLGTVTQPTCSVATGSFSITNYNASYTYAVSPSTGVTVSGSGITAPAGTYTVTATLGSCTSVASASKTVNAQPATPVQPTLGSVTQPTCSLATGSFSITNYNASYTYVVSPSTGVTVSGSGITAPAGTYTVIATLGTCTSVASASATVNAQTTNTWSASGWSTGLPPTSSQKIVFAHDYSSSADIAGCSCQVTSGTVVINSGHTLTVTNDVKITGAGSLTFEDGASLVQTNNAAANTGNITYKRKTTPLKQFDYTYWCSPVVGATLSQLATNSLMYSFSPTANLYVYQTGATTMAQGVGYIGRAPSGLTYAPTQIVQTSFVGAPGNGVINTPILKDTTAYNLIGNPYPSALDADSFIATNSAVINGTIYFWTHNTAITNNAYTINDYAKYNYTGSVGTAAPGTSIVPTGKIAAGQGFFVEAKTSLANGTYSATFNNAMRLAGNNTQFFKNGASGNTTTSISEGLERHRVWLSLRSPQGAYNQMLVGYVQGATNDFDSLFDGKTLAVGNSVSIYTKTGTDNLAIQGKSLPFSELDVIPVAYSTSLNGQLAVYLDDFDGVFTTQNVYLLDKATNTFHDLKEAPYTFVTTNGNFEQRFELRFTTQALGTTIPTVTDNDIKIITANHQLEILSPAMAITKVTVYDVLGKLLFTQNNLNTNLFQTSSLQIAPQILLVKVTLDNGQSFTKKTVIE